MNQSNKISQSLSNNTPENILQYSKNIDHVQKLNSENFHDLLLDYTLVFKNNSLYFNNIKCGIYNFNFDEEITIQGSLEPSDVERIIELATSCQHHEFSASSPSMMLHQISLMTLVHILPGFKKIEEYHLKRRNDLIWEYGSREIIIEVTGRKYRERFESIENEINGMLLIINKYTLNPLTKDTDNICEMSLENDNRSVNFILDRVRKQAESVKHRMLYDKSLLDFFSNLPNSHVRACESAYIKYCKEKVYEQSQEPDDKYVKDCISQLSEGLISLQETEFGCSHYYNIDLQLVRDSDDYKILIEEKKKSKITLSTIPKAVNESGILKFEEKEVINKSRLYDKIDFCWLTNGAYESCVKYPEVKSVREEYVKIRVGEVIERFFTYVNLYKIMDNLCVKRYGTTLHDFHSKKRRIIRHIKPKRRYKDDDLNFDYEMMRLSYYNLKFDVDPDHDRLFEDMTTPDYVREIFKNSRDVFELRMKRRIALSAIKVRKPRKPFRVNHWKLKGIYCECIIMGKLFEKDMGVMYVSYYSDYQLTKTQKWRLPDVEGYTVGLERCLALTLAVGSRKLSRKVSDNMLMLYYRLINENSWGVSKFLKPYRYFSSGIAMGSSRTKDQIPKILKAAEGYNSDKLSIRYLTMLLKNSDNTPGRTPAFDLSFENIGYECFLLNLCPSKTYGSNRHLVNVLTELSDEIDLYNDSMSSVREIFDDFKNIIKSKSNKKDFLTSEYYNHLKLLDKISNRTDGRFTFSPCSLLMCKRDLDSLHLRPELYRTPSIDQLCTARGSTSNFTFEPKMALESINEITRKMESGSTTRLALRLLNRSPVDLTMRMFDKDQVGGDREISILNAGFRICQSISESYFKNLGSQSGVDLLADRLKTLNYTNSISECLEAKVSRLLTIDQTRWGPNFNTITFGLLALMTGCLTTEYYTPSFVCLISEFKIFEMPMLEPELAGKQDISFSLPGKVGRSHMGQGIFHYASSFYHSLSLLSIKRLFYKTINISPKSCIIRTFCTSDDASIVAYNSTSCNQNQKNKVKSKIRYLYSFFESIIHLYGIKTNVTKNIDSSSTIEFNSMYYSKEGIGSNDIKFLYSLIDPTTTGNLYRDCNMPFISFDRAINSGCNIDNSLIIGKCVFLIKMRQWKARGHIVMPPSNDYLMTGSDILEPHDPKMLDSLLFTNGLRFNRKRRIKEVHSKSDNIYKLTRIKQESNLESLMNSNVSDKFRSLQTYNNVNNILVPVSSLFRNLAPESNAISNEFFMREFFSSKDLIGILKSSDQKMSSTLYQKCWTKRTMFTFKILKQRRFNDFDPMSYIISTRDPVNRIQNLNDQDNLILHMYRHKVRYDLDKESKLLYSKMDVQYCINLLSKMKNELEFSSPNVVQMIYNPYRRVIEYTRQMRIWDRSTSTLARVININCVRNISKLRHSICYTNTESCTAYYSRYDYYKGTFPEFIPSSLGEWPQVAVHQISVKLNDVTLDENILKLICEKENNFRRSKSQTPYLVLRKKFSQDKDNMDSVSQFSMDMSEAISDLHYHEYCHIELPSEYSYLATSYPLRQSILLSMLSELSNQGACLFKNIDSVIAGEHTVTYFTKGMMREIEWIVSERITSMICEKSNREKSKLFVHDLFKNIFENKVEDYFPIYAMLSVTQPNYISFTKRGRRIDIEDLRQIIFEDSKKEDICIEKYNLIDLKFPKKKISDELELDILSTDSDIVSDEIGTENIECQASEDIEVVEPDEGLNMELIEKMMDKMSDLEFDNIMTNMDVLMNIGEGSDSQSSISGNSSDDTEYY